MTTHEPDKLVEDTDAQLNPLPLANIFVFGSNLAGRHGKGAALHALLHHHAIYGNGVGPQGESYAIPTKDAQLNPLPLAKIAEYIHIFITGAARWPELQFNITRIGAGLAGYDWDTDIRTLFPEKLPPNCRFIGEPCPLCQEQP